MMVTLSWHLILMVVVTILFIIWIVRQFDEYEDWGILTALPTLLLLLVIWAVYGGIVWW